MALYLRENCPVQYRCACGLDSPLYSLYFCRYCFVLRCRYCVSQELDFFYCSNCTTSRLASEVDITRYEFDFSRTKQVAALPSTLSLEPAFCWRCPTCYDCPRCGCPLSPKASNVIQPEQTNTESSGTEVTGEASASSQSTASSTTTATTTSSKKVFYLACGYCRWSTRDVKIEDKPTVEVDWGQRPMPNQDYYNGLKAYYYAWEERRRLEPKYWEQVRQQAAHKVKRRVQSLARGLTPMEYISPAADKTGLMRAIDAHKAKTGDPSWRKRQFGVAPTIQLPELPDTSGLELKTYTAEELFDSEDTTSWTAPVEDLFKTLLLDQCVRDPLGQLHSTDDFVPVPRPLLARRFQRCRQCQHILCRSEQKQAKFKIQMLAYSHVPEVSLSPLQNCLQLGRTEPIILSLRNPLPYATSVVLLPAVAANDNDGDQTAAGAVVELPQDELLLPAPPDIDDVVGGGDTATTSAPSTEPACIVERRANKIWIALKVTPNRLHSNKIIFMLQYEYHKPVTLLSSKSGPAGPPAAEKQSVKVAVSIDIGDAVGQL